jgi:hypothetical protein
MSNISIKSTRSSQINDQEIVYFGSDPSNRPLEVLVFSNQKRPNSQILQKKWKDRQGNRRAPLLVVCLHQDKAYVCGPNGEKPPIYNDLDINQIERICNEALEEPNRFSATSVLTSYLPSIEDDLPGIRNEGFLSNNELKYGVKSVDKWIEACSKAQKVLKNGNNRLIESLEFDIDKRDNFTKFLRFKDQKRALGILLDRGISPDLSNPDYANQSPVSHGLSIARQENLPYLIIKSGGLLRIYPVDSDRGVGRRGRTETFIEINTSIISDENSGLLWLIFSGNALKKNGSLNLLIESSLRYGFNLAKGLRKRVYNEVIPILSQGIFESKKILKPTKHELDRVFDLSLTLLFRLLFIAYAEDRNLLPYKTNQEYRRNSLQSVADALLNIEDEEILLDSSDSYWQQINQLFKAVDAGNIAWSIPKYNGGLFSTNKEVSDIGHELSNLSLPNNVLLVALKGLLTSETDQGKLAVDFRSLSVREFGSIYEGLLESELVFAKSDLVVESTKIYRPAKENEVPIIKKNHTYIQNSSGQRKESASYYTQQFIVDDLLENSLVSAIQDHFLRLDKMSDKDAGLSFFDLKVADIAMGSGHFLISAVDRIEQEFEIYRNIRPLPEVTLELQQLRSSALKILSQFGENPVIEDGQLLRRLIAKRCIYGVDINYMAVELSRLAMWIHTFVPGLPLSFLDRNLVHGNSITGVGTFKEVESLINSVNDNDVQQNLFALNPEAIIGDARIPLKKLALLSDATVEDVNRSRQAWEQAKKATKPAKALFDIISGTRMSELSFPINILDEWENVKNTLFNSAYRSNALQNIEADNFIHFPSTFPEVFLRNRSGFDVIIGNPPWQELMVDQDGFWCLYYPGLRGMNQEDKNSKIAELKIENPELENKYQLSLIENSQLRKALLSGPYIGMGDGDPDLYKAFAWRFMDLTNDSGHIGVVLPRDAMITSGSKYFRESLFKQKKVTITTLTNNKGWVFQDVHQQYTIALVNVQKGISDAAKFYLKGPYNTKEDFDRNFTYKGEKFTSNDISLWNDSYSLPTLQSPESIGVFKSMRLFPNLNFDQSDSWRVRPYREFDATLDGPKHKAIFQLDYDNCPENFWPVYKGTSINLWEPDSGIYFGGADPNLALQTINNRRKKGQAFSEFDRSIVEDPDTNPALQPRIGFRLVSRSTDTRTVRVSLVPPNVFLASHVPYMLWPRGNAHDQAYLLGVMSSIPFDWYARLFVEKNISFYLLQCFPIPRPPENDFFRKRIIQISGRLASIDERYKKWANEVEVDYGPIDEITKNQMIFDLDAVVAHLYGLSVDDLKYIFTSFHKGWDCESRLESTIKYYENYQGIDR